MATGYNESKFSVAANTWQTNS